MHGIHAGHEIFLGVTRLWRRRLALGWLSPGA